MRSNLAILLREVYSKKKLLNTRGPKRTKAPPTPSGLFFFSTSEDLAGLGSALWSKGCGTGVRRLIWASVSTRRCWKTHVHFWEHALYFFNIPFSATRLGEATAGHLQQWVWVCQQKKHEHRQRTFVVTRARKNTKWQAIAEMYAPLEQWTRRRWSKVGKREGKQVRLSLFCIFCQCWIVQFVGLSIPEPVRIPVLILHYRVSDCHPMHALLVMTGSGFEINLVHERGAHLILRSGELIWRVLRAACYNRCIAVHHCRGSPVPRWHDGGAIVLLGQRRELERRERQWRRSMRDAELYCGDRQSWSHSGSRDWWLQYSAARARCDVTTPGVVKRVEVENRWERTAQIEAVLIGWSLCNFGRRACWGRFVRWQWMSHCRSMHVGGAWVLASRNRACSVERWAWGWDRERKRSYRWCNL